MIKLKINLLQVLHFRTVRLAVWLGGLDVAEELEQAGVQFRTQDWLPQVA